MAKKKKVKRTQEMQDHWNSVIELGPHPALQFSQSRRTIQHCKSGSVSDAGMSVGWAQKQNDWLVVCLPEELHTGNLGIDSGYGVRSWERDFITQMELLHWTAEQLGVDIFENAGVTLHE